jgi:tetratricopeptide (TPR) repeat protein
MGDRAQQAEVLAEIGLRYSLLGEWLKATQALEESLALFSELGESLAVAKVSEQLGRLSLTTGKIGEAIEHFNLSLQIRRQIVDRGKRVANLDVPWDRLRCQ